jgi:hypothetical protein
LQSLISFPLPYSNKRKWIESIWLRTGYSGGLVTTQYNTGFYIVGEFPYHLNTCHLHNKDVAPWSPLIFIYMHTNIIAKVFFIKIN